MSQTHRCCTGAEAARTHQQPTRSRSRECGDTANALRSQSFAPAGTGGNPPGGGGGGAGPPGPPGGPNPPAPPTQNPPPGQAGLVPAANGALKGHAPEIFDRDRRKTTKFVLEFDLWRMCNINAKIMMNPFQRVAVALSYIKGPRVGDWVASRGTEGGHPRP